MLYLGLSSPPHPVPTRHLSHPFPWIISQPDTTNAGAPGSLISSPPPPQCHRLAMLRCIVPQYSVSG